jgi:hypothetical protein
MTNYPSYQELPELPEHSDTDLKSEVWNRVLRASLSMPGAKIDRETYLRKELSKRCTPEVVDKAIATRPALAGVPKDTIEAVAKSTIKLHRAGVSSVSFVAGVPGGWWIAGSIPADLTQFFWHVIVVLQKLAYLYGWPSLMNDKEELDDETLLVFTIFVGVMFGASSASKALGELAERVAQQVMKRLPQKALTKYAVYRVAKEIAKWIGIKLTKESFARALSKLVPVVSGFLSGGISWLLFSEMSRRLQRHLETLQLAQADSEYGGVLDGDSAPAPSSQVI